MTSSHSTGSSRAGTPIRAQARWRRSIALAVSAIAAAAMFGPATASAGWYDIDDLGNTTPAGHGSAPDPVNDNGGATEPALPGVTAAAAIVVDRASGVVLGAKNPDLRWAPASTTKMMTGLLPPKQSPRATCRSQTPSRSRATWTSRAVAKPG